MEAYATQNRGTTFTSRIGFVVEKCCDCGLPFAMTTEFEAKKRSNPGTTFYCPAGHPQHYTGKSEAQKLRDELARVRSQNDQTLARLRDEAATNRRRAIAAKGQLTRVKNRVKNGVCPCCNRHFANLHQHMTTQHPGFAA